MSVDPLSGKYMPDFSVQHSNFVLTVQIGPFWKAPLVL